MEDYESYYVVGLHFLMLPRLANHEASGWVKKGAYFLVDFFHNCTPLSFIALFP